MFVFAVAATVLAGGCAARSGGPASPSGGADQTTAAGGQATASPSSGPSQPVKELPSEDVPAIPPASCAVTRPGHPPFRAPKPYRPTPPAYYREAWYGSDRLWTTVLQGGEIWRALPHDATGFSQKTFWWSKEFDLTKEEQPKISVVGRRLDVVGPTFSAGNPGTNGFKAFDNIGEFMLVGVSVPTPGCWEITATYRAAALSIVVWIDND